MRKSGRKKSPKTEELRKTTVWHKSLAIELQVEKKRAWKHTPKNRKSNKKFATQYTTKTHPSESPSSPDPIFRNEKIPMFNLHPLALTTQSPTVWASQRNAQRDSSVSLGFISTSFPGRGERRPISVWEHIPTERSEHRGFLTFKTGY